MIELRFHSRGGQGGVVAGKLLAVAVFKENRHVQAFPTFGVERRSAPVMAFVRIDEQPIRVRNQIYEPDHVVVLDASLLQTLDVTLGLKEGGTILINTPKLASELGFRNGFNVVTVDASAIAVRNGLGSITQPIVNTAILGAVAKVLGCVSLDSVIAAIEEEIPGKTQANVNAAREAFESA
jgi:2-oxoacid:acceptor oxidoreductase gamma subunit (pyruvate/2-ketoisovalerate family)